jgi:histidinol-phosphatase
MTSRLQFCIQAAETAGRSTLAHFQNLASFELKADQSPLTIADQTAERVLRELLAHSYPEDAIYGEEEGRSGDSEYVWVIDPIDGTKSFIAGVPLYATLFSCEHHGQPIVAASYFPALGQMFYAELGQGAFLNGREIRVATETPLNQTVICVGSHKSLEKYGKLAGFQKVAAQVMATRTWCDAYGHCLVAAGRVHAMVDPVVMPYDLSAVGLIVEEAGGRFTDFSGGVRPQSEAVSSNGVLHDWLLEQF